MDDAAEHRVTFHNNAVSFHQLGGGIELVAGHVGIGVLPGIDNHHCGGLILRLHGKFRDTEGDRRTEHRAKKDLKDMLPQHPKQFQKVDRFLCEVKAAVHNIYCNDNADITVN